jgi:hypothetical protein
MTPWAFRESTGTDFNGILTTCPFLDVIITSVDLSGMTDENIRSPVLALKLAILTPCPPLF